MPKQRECILFTQLLINLPGASTIIEYHNLAVYVIQEIEKCNLFH
jgi:hypothetical protein